MTPGESCCEPLIRTAPVRLPRGTCLSRGGRGGGANDAPDLIGRIVLSANREQRRGGGKIDRVDHTLDFAGDGDVLSRAIRARRRHFVVAGWVLGAVVALAIPDATGIAVGQRKFPAIDRLPGPICNRDRGVRA